MTIIERFHLQYLFWMFWMNFLAICEPFEIDFDMF